MELITIPLNNLKKYRQEKNYSLKDMADRLGISKTFYFQIENGYRNLSYGNALKIALILETTTDILFRNEYISMIKNKK